MILEGNAISKLIRTTYGSFSGEDLMHDLPGLCTATALGTALVDHLKARINKQKPHKKIAKDAIRQLYTPTEAVRLVVELRVPKLP